ncbi:hypothetical protein K505DRAFT_235277 [Melanomma pulvis-pyrius CBS 109.77]|uniref:Protection of telomeres protein 1 n=1 Tax=Melanomma pulvis-pyrius CBS 109.77 TaxID=1314802 RepID=A0A6A6XLZ9_9PLEO|nr:hypothetical protein K505DRAFT_235277 [Melanomma pulvis-pyrius CBS 109.77]
MALPGYLSIKEAVHDGQSGNFIGVLTHFEAPYKSKGDDWVLEFTIQDEFSAGSATNDSTAFCRIFRRTQDKLPKLGAIGDIVLIRNVMVRTWGSKKHFISNARLHTAFLLFQSKHVPVPELSTGYSEGGLSRLLFTSNIATQDPSSDEQMAIIYLKAAAVPHLAEFQQQSVKRTVEPAPRYNNKKALLQDITLHKYHDIVGEVVKFFSPNPSTIDLYVTDYTTNQDLFLYEDPEEADIEDAEFASARKWPGPFGQMTIAIRLWEPHSSYASSYIREGDIVSLQDVHAKLSQANKLEGALHQDQRYPEKIKICKVKYTKQIEDHKARKAAYESAYAQRRARRTLAQNVPKKPSAKISAKRKEMQRLQKELEQKELEKKAEEEATARAGINPHVRASFPEIKLSTIAEIINNPSLTIQTPEGVEIVLPFVNAKYRTRIRVVDFFPNDLNDFARSMADPNWNTALNEMSGNEQRHDQGWKWGFALLVEDANAPTGTTPERLRLFVNNGAGQHLLKMNASDLKKDPKRQSITQLEQKLFILWGNLFELKQDLSSKGIKFPLPSGDPRLQNMPFDCCIEEYGSKVPKSDYWPYGWQRMHQPMLTVIMD